LGGTSPCTPRSAISLSLRHCHANPDSLVILFQVRNSVRPMHLFHNRDRDYYFKLPVKRSGMPNQLLGVLLHTLAISGLSRARTELFQLLVIPSLAPHPVQAIRQSPRHRDLGNLPPSPHRQILTAPHSWSLRTVTCAASTSRKRGNELPCFVMCPSRSPLPAGLLQRHRPQITRDLLATLKPIRSPDDQLH
jgi:hypothetical protein